MVGLPERRRGDLERSIRRLFAKARGWNRIAKAARGDHRYRAYLQKKRAIERIEELRPGAVRVDSVEEGEAGAITVGLSIRRQGRLHVVLTSEDHAPGGRWEDVAWLSREHGDA